MIFLASPYSDPDFAVVTVRVIKTQRIVAKLLSQGFPIFSPIVHCHELSTLFNLPTDASHWQCYNTSFLRKADALYILKLPGWDKSRGVTQEIKLAEQLDIPIIGLDENGQATIGYSLS